MSEQVFCFPASRPIDRSGSGCFSGCGLYCLKFECHECGDTMHVRPYQIVFESKLHMKDCVTKHMGDPGHWYIAGRKTRDVNIGGKRIYFTMLRLECPYCGVNVYVRGDVNGYCSSCGTNYRVVVPRECTHDVP